MNFQTVTNYLTDQLHAGIEAPVPLALTFGLAVLLGWAVTRLYYAQRIARLRRSVDRKESMILALQGVAPLAAANAQTRPGSRMADTVEDARDPRIRRRALLKITNAIDAAVLASRGVDPRETARAIDAMTVALLAARGSFGLPVPEPGTSDALDLEAGARLLELVRPALFLGHDDEARRSVELFLRHMVAPKAPPQKAAIRA